MNTSSPWLLDVFRRRPKTRPTGTDPRRRRAPARPPFLLHREHLEARLPLAITIFEGLPGITKYTTIAAEGGDDIFIQQAATVPQSLLIATNSSFNAYRAIPNIAALDSFAVTDAQPVQVRDLERIGIGGENTTRFVLPQGGQRPGNIDYISYGGQQWFFNPIPNSLSGNFIGDPEVAGTIYPESWNVIEPGVERLPIIGFIGRNAVVEVRWSRPVPVTADIFPEAFFPSLGKTGPTRTSTGTRQVDLAGNVSIASSFQLPLGQLGLGIAPGTLVGQLTLHDGSTNEATVQFATDTLLPLAGSTRIPLRFAPSSVPDPTTDTTPYSDVVEIFVGDTTRRRRVSGEFELATGQLHFVWTSANASPGPQDPGRVTLNATYGLRQAASRPISVTFAPGHTISNELNIDLVTPNASIKVNSDIVQTKGSIRLSATETTLNAKVVAADRLDIRPFEFAPSQTLQASAVAAISAGKVTLISVPSGLGGSGYPVGNGKLNVTISAPTSTTETKVQAKATATVDQFGQVTQIIVTDPGSGYTAPPLVTLASPAPLVTRIPERITFNTSVSATNYDLRYGDDPVTTNVNRGRLFVSGTGSLTTTTGSVFVQADTADIVVEGTIDATRHSYLMRSTKETESRAPFVFTTTSPATGSATGLIRSRTGSVAITLGNELSPPTNGGSLANVLNIKTDIDSLRVTAAGNASDSVYPYDLNVSDIDTLLVDAVPASSGRISLQAANTVSFRAAIQTDGDVAIDAGLAFTVDAPITSARGTISIEAADVNVRNSLRVLDAPVDALRNDISLHATGGGIAVGSEITAVNGVRLRQDNPTGGTGGISGATRIAARRATLDAQGDISIRTAVDSLDARAIGDVAISELDDITIPLLRSDGFVTLLAAGTDPGENSGRSPNLIALTAALEGVLRFSASAPRGSIDVVTNTERLAALGDGSLIAGGAAPPMEAAGTVKIRSTAGDLDISDAPIGGGSAVAARVVATDPFKADFALNRPGFVASTLTAIDNESLIIDGISLKPGDVILVQGQFNKNENGLYVVTNPGADNLPWMLTRPSAYDTSRELPSNTTVRVLEGKGAGRVYSLSFDSTFGESPLLVTPVPNVAQSQRVTVATIEQLSGSYDASLGMISGSDLSLTVDGVPLAPNDRVLVRHGVTGEARDAQRNILPTEASNGVYVYSPGSIGFPGNFGWTLTRATDLGTGRPITLGNVTVDKGTFQTSLTGTAFQLSYDPLGIDPMDVTLYDGTGIARTNIGTDNINRKVQLIVSSTAGRNNAAGSLGRMISLQEANDLDGTANPSQKSDILFSAVLAGAIRLEQELPRITRGYSIDADNRVKLAGFHETQAGSTRLLVDSVDGLAPGYLVTGPGIEAGTVIQAITRPSAITLSRAASNQVIPGPGKGEFTFIPAANTLSGTVTLGSDTMAQVNTSNLAAVTKGQLIIGPGLAGNTTVVDTIAGPGGIASSGPHSIKLSPNPTSTTSGKYSFFNQPFTGGLVRPSGVSLAQAIVIDGQNISQTVTGANVFRQSGGATILAEDVIQLTGGFRDFQDIQPGMLVTGFGIRAGTKVLHTPTTDPDKILQPNQLRLDSGVNAVVNSRTTVTVSLGISGIVFAGGGRLSGTYLGGFDAGSAIRVEGSPGQSTVPASSSSPVVIDDVVIGVNEVGRRLGNLFGIVVDDGLKARIEGSTIVFSSGAGIRAFGTADVDVMMTDIGGTGTPNTLGIDADLTSGEVANPTAIGRVTVGGRGGASEVVESRRVRVLDVAGLVIGMSVRGTPIAVGGVLAPVVPSDCLVSLVQQDPSGSGGFVHLSTEISYRDGDALQFVPRTGTPLTRTVTTRSHVRFNQVGVEVRGTGTFEMVNTSVSDNNYDGLRIFGGQYLIGDSTTRTSRSNVFVRNGYRAIEISEDAEPRNPQTADRKIQGNYFGVDRDNSPGPNERPPALYIDGPLPTGGNGNIASRLGLRPRASNIDVYGNLHGVRPEAPTAYLAAPLDNDGIDLLSDIDNRVKVESEAARINRIVLHLEDDADAIDAATVIAAAFTVRYSPSVVVTDWNGPGVETWVSGRDYTFAFDETRREVSFQRTTDLPAGSYLISVDNSTASGVRDVDGNAILANGEPGSVTTLFEVILDARLDGPELPGETEFIGPTPDGSTLVVNAVRVETKNIQIENDNDIVIQGLVEAVQPGRRIVVKSTRGRVYFQGAGELRAPAVSLSAQGDSQLRIGPSTLIRSATIANGALEIISSGDMRQTGPITATTLSVSALGGLVDLSDAGNAVNVFTGSAAYAGKNVTFVNSRGFTVGGSGVTAGTSAVLDGQISLTALSGDLTVAAPLSAPQDVAFARAPAGRVVVNAAVTNNVRPLIRQDSSGTVVDGGFTVGDMNALTSAVQLINTLPAGVVYEIVVAASFTLDRTITFGNAVDLRGSGSGMVLSGSGAAADGIVFGPTAAGSRLMNLAFANFSGTAIAIDRAPNVMVRGVTVTNSGTGLALSGDVVGTTVQGSTFRSVDVALRLSEAKSATIGGNDVAERIRIEGARRAGILATGLNAGTKVIRPTFTSSPSTRVRLNIRSSRNLRVIGTVIERATGTRPTSGTVRPSFNLFGR
jgi:hypothetical protein